MTTDELDLLNRLPCSATTVPARLDRALRSLRQLGKIVSVFPPDGAEEWLDVAENVEKRANMAPTTPPAGR